jgi:acyl transferase domain-containing protein/acyl carrier protein
MSDQLPPNRQPIAVVGVSALFPGSTDATGFWHDILAGSDLIRDVPESHWLVDDFHDPDPAADDKTYARRGSFLDPIDFDALGWGVPPATIPATDTAQLLALVVAQQVLQDAARGQFETMDRSRISVILGFAGATELISTMAGRMQRPIWVKGLREAGLPEDQVQDACDRITANYVPWQEATFPGLLGNVVAGRIANRLNLGGTNCVTDAACASSLSALSMAVSELQLGNSDLAITGGVDTMNDIVMFMCFSKTPALSPTGDCRPFSDQADGTMLGEGLAMIALKRLDDAERDGDRIYAVIRGVGASSDGRSKSVYAPVSAGQSQALRRAYELAGYGPETVELMEAHGTGTKAGDAAEFEGLRQVFDESGRPDRQWCALGSVKSQIGHTKAAAGAAGLFKSIMALHHKVLPPTIKVTAPNPNLRLPETPFYLSTKLRPWIRDSGHPRRASVSSFGFGGSNFHVTLEEYTGAAPRPERLQTIGRELVLLSGPGAAAVAAQARELAESKDTLGNVARQTLRDFDTSAQARLAVVASGPADLADKLLVAASRIEAMVVGAADSFVLPDGSAFGVGHQDGKVAFLFPGQGSHYLGMGAGLAMGFDAARGPWDRAADVELEPGTSLQEVVFPRPVFGADPERSLAERLTTTQWAQPAIGCASLAQLALLRGIGVRADMVGGHSFGEVTALFAADVLNEADLLRVARRRGELMHSAAAVPGAMTAIPLPVEQVADLLSAAALPVVVANHNGPADVVVSGPTDAIEELENKLATTGVTARRLPVATAFHSGVVSGSCAPFAEFLDGVHFAPPRVPVYSNATAAAHDDAPDAIRAALAGQIASPVRFVEMVHAMYEAGARTFVEVGPASVLTGLVERILADEPHLAVSLDRKAKDDVDSLLRALARLAAAGVPFQAGELFAEYRRSAEDSTAPAVAKLAVPIQGSNYGKLYPPPGGSQALPGPNPVRAAVHADPVQNGHGPPVTAPQAPLPPVQSAQPPTPTTGPEVAPVGGPSAWVQAFQESQRQTAEAHAVYQRASAESYAAFLQTAEGGFLGLTALAGGQVTGIPAAQPVFAAMDPGPAVRVEVSTAVPTPAPPVAPTEPTPAAPVALTVVVAPQITAAAPALDLQALMMAVVAEKTGYPADMLEADMDLEGDLGIDSIKRVEILAALQDKAPELPPVDTGTMASLHTPGAIVEYLQNLLADPGRTSEHLEPSTPESEPPTQAPVAVALGRYRLELMDVPTTGLAQLGLLQDEVHVIGGGGELDEALVAELRARGVDARATANLPDGAVACIYLGGLRDIRDDDAAVAVNREAFALARRLAGRLETGRGVFVTVQDTGGAFGMGPLDAHRAWLAGLPALVKTSRHEWPLASLKSIDLQRGGRDARALATALADELLQGGGEIEVALTTRGERFTLRSVNEPVALGQPVIHAGEVVLVSGGARGVTAACVQAWAADCRARFVLLGRTALTEEPNCCGFIDDEAGLKKALLDEARAAEQAPRPAELGARVQEVLANREIRRALTAVERAGAQVRYEAVDVCDAQELGRTLDRVRTEWGPIAGVVHAAGVLADKKISEKTDEQFDRVFDTKVAGLRSLLAATADDPLKLLCVFSSISARCGNTGQADYAMANEVLAKVAESEHRRRPAMLVKSMAWGPWEGGMVTPQLKRRFAELGVPMIPVAQGARMFADEMCSAQRDQVELVLGGEPRSESLLADGEEAKVHELELRVRRETHAYLEGHAIGGTPVVPVVLAAEWLSRGARCFRPGLSLVALHDLKVLKGIRLNSFDNGGDRFVIQGRQLQDSNGWMLLLELRGPGGTLHYSARAEMAAQDRAPKNGLPDLPLDVWVGEPLYRDLLFHRGAFEVIEEMHGISDHGVSAQVRGVKRAGWPGEPWQTDVAALDGALQLAVLYGRRMLHHANLPTSIEELRSYGTLPSTGRIRASAYRRTVSNAAVTTDIVLTDEQGQRLAELRGVQNHALPR